MNDEELAAGFCAGLRVKAAYCAAALDSRGDPCDETRLLKNILASRT